MPRASGAPDPVRGRQNGYQGGFLEEAAMPEQDYEEKAPRQRHIECRRTGRCPVWLGWKPSRGWGRKFRDVVGLEHAGPQT